MAASVNILAYGGSFGSKLYNIHTNEGKTNRAKEEDLWRQRKQADRVAGDYQKNVDDSSVNGLVWIIFVYFLPV